MVSNYSCFLAPISVSSPSSSAVSRKCRAFNRSFPRAALEDISRSKPDSKTASKIHAHQRHSSRHDVDKSLPVGVAPANYRVYPDGFPASLTPPPPPIHYTVPLLGWALETLVFGIFPRTRARKLGDIYTSSGFLTRMHIIADRTAILELIKDYETFVCKNANPVILAQAGEKFLLNLDGAEHREVRHKLTPAFSPKLFPFYTDRIRHRAELAWKKIADETSNPSAGKKKILLDDMISELYFVGMIEMVNGTGMNSSEYSRLSALYPDYCAMLFAPPYSGAFKRGMKSREEMLCIVGDIIRRMLVDDADIIDELREYGDVIFSKGAKEIMKGRVSIAHIWAAKTDYIVGPGASNDPGLIREHAEMSLSLWFAGTTSSAATTSSALFEMGFDKHNIWNRLAKEQNRIAGEAGGDRQVLYQQTKDMILLESFIDEITRLHPAFPSGNRLATRDCEVFGRRIEKNSVISLDFFAANMDERYYTDPEKLVMDRFVPDDKTGALLEPYPLSFGGKGTAHYCIGASITKLVMKTTLSILLREYTMEMDETQSRKYSVIPDHKPESGVVITALKPRF